MRLGLIDFANEQLPRLHAAGADDRIVNKSLWLDRYVDFGVHVPERSSYGSIVILGTIFCLVFSALHWQ